MMLPTYIIFPANPNGRAYKLVSTVSRMESME